MFAPGKGFLEIGAGGGDGKSFIRLNELKFDAVRVLFFCHRENGCTTTEFVWVGEAYHIRPAFWCCLFPLIPRPERERERVCNRTAFSLPRDGV